MATILLKRSSAPSAVPSPSSLEVGEVALNTADGKLFMKKVDGQVVPVGDTSQFYTKAEADSRYATYSTQLQFRRGDRATIASVVLLQGEPFFATDTKSLYIGDGATPGGLQLSGGSGSIDGGTANG
jgi:hypothetical protein